MDLLEKTNKLEKQFTVTGYVVNPQRTKLLLVRHKKLGKWLPAGGHLETNELPHLAAIREVYEETGIQAKIISFGEVDLELKGDLDTQIPKPYALCYQLIPKFGDTAEHIHLDMQYVLEAEESKTYKANTLEVYSARWCDKDEIITRICTFDSVIGFAKLNLKQNE